MILDANKQVEPFVAVVSRSRFRSLWFAQITSQIAVNILLFTLALKVYQTTSSNTAVSGIFIAYSIPAVVVGMVAGTISDYLDRRSVLLICDIVRACGTVLLYFALSKIFLVYIIVFLNAIVTQFYVPSEAPLIPSLVRKDQILTANSLFSFTFYSSMGIGFILAGPLLRLIHLEGVFLTVCLLYLFAAWNVSKIPSQKINGDVLTRVVKRSFTHVILRMKEELGKGIAYIRNFPVVSDALILLTATQITLVLLATLGPGFADRMLNIDIRDASLVIVGPVVVGIISGALLVGGVGMQWKRSKLVERGIFGASSILILLAIIVYLKRIPLFFGFERIIAVPLAIILFYLLGICNSFMDVPSNSVIQKEADSAMRGRIYGLLCASVGGIGVFPVVLGGIAADLLGVDKVIFILGTLILLYGFYRMRYNKEY